jgi:hypothetical protein
MSHGPSGSNVECTDISTTERVLDPLMMTLGNARSAA